MGDLGDRLRAVAGAVALSVEGFEGDRLERQQNPPSLALALALVGAGVGASKEAHPQPVGPSYQAHAQAGLEPRLKVLRPPTDPQCSARG